MITHTGAGRCRLMHGGYGHGAGTKAGRLRVFSRIQAAWQVLPQAAANIALRPCGASLAQQLGHGDSWVTGTGRAGGIYASRARAARRRMRV